MVKKIIQGSSFPYQTFIVCAELVLKQQKQWAFLITNITFYGSISDFDIVIFFIYVVKWDVWLCNYYYFFNTVVK